MQKQSSMSPLEISIYNDCNYYNSRYKVKKISEISYYHRSQKKNRKRNDKAMQRQEMHTATVFQHKFYRIGDSTIWNLTSMRGLGHQSLCILIDGERIPYLPRSWIGLYVDGGITKQTSQCLNKKEFLDVECIWIAGIITHPLDYIIALTGIEVWGHRNSARLELITEGSQCNSQRKFCWHSDYAEMKAHNSHDRVCASMPYWCERSTVWDLTGAELRLSISFCWGRNLFLVDPMLDVAFKECV